MIIISIFLHLLLVEYVYGLSKKEYQDNIIRETSVFRGQKYYISNGNRSFQGPWTEERFFDLWMERKPYIDAIYLPIGWTGSEIINREGWRNINNWALENYLENLDKKMKYFTIIQIAKGFENNLKVYVNLPQDLNITVYATGNTSGSKIIPIPLLKEELEPIGLKKKYLVSFTGSYFAHPMRDKLRDTWKHRYLFNEPHDNWKEDIEQSWFTLCPRGFGPSSFRISETIQLGSIPIYVYDDAGGAWLPYQKSIDWTKMAIVLHENDIHKLGDIITQKEKTGEMKKMIKYINEKKHMFTYDYMLNYIMNNITHI